MSTNINNIDRELSSFKAKKAREVWHVLLNNIKNDWLFWTHSVDVFNTILNDVDAGITTFTELLETSTMDMHRVVKTMSFWNRKIIEHFAISQFIFSNNMSQDDIEFFLCLSNVQSYAWQLKKLKQIRNINTSGIKDGRISLEIAKCYRIIGKEDERLKKLTVSVGENYLQKLKTAKIIEFKVNKENLDGKYVLSKQFSTILWGLEYNAVQNPKNSVFLIEAWLIYNRNCTDIHASFNVWDIPPQLSIDEQYAISVNDFTTILCIVNEIHSFISRITLKPISSP